MSLSDDDFLARLRSTMADDGKEGSAELDDDPELERLRQLRAVWLAMPDEEPSDKGMAALMAAARTKAAEMQPKPSWWQAFLATLRRPPVLALATVVVVVGGAVFVTRHHEAIEAPAVMAPPAAAPSGTVAREETELSRGPSSGSSAPVTDSSKETVRTTGAAAGSSATPTTKADVAVPSVPRAEPTIANPRPQTHHHPGSPDSSLAPAPPAKVVAKPADDKAPEALRQKDTDRLGVDQSPTSESGHGKAAGGGESSTGGASSDPAAAQPVAPPPPPPAPRPVTTPTANSSETSLDQLFKQCQLAAARGDCDAVKQLAARIAKASATVYRDRVTKDAAVVKCLQ